jgi:hypothetical protein
MNAASSSGRSPANEDDQRVYRLAFVGRKGRDVDEAGDARVAAGLGDDDSAVGVAHEDGLATEVVEDALGGGHVAFEGYGRVLYDGDSVTLGA